MTLRKTEEIFGLILVVNLKPDEKKEKDDFSVSDTGGSEEKIRLPQQESNLSKPDPDLKIRGGGGGDGGLSLQKKKFGPQFGLKIRGGRVSRTPPLDPPLPMTFWLLVLIL